MSMAFSIFVTVVACILIHVIVRAETNILNAIKDLKKELKWK